MKDFLELRKFIAPEFVYGRGALELAGRYARSLAATKVLIVTDEGVRAAGWTGKVESSVRLEGIPYVIFDHVTPNPKDTEVMAGVEIYRREGCDLILSVGGGSPTDCAKGIGICAANGGHILHYAGIDAVPMPGPPLICVPTTGGASADLSQFAMITDAVRKVKTSIISKMVVPDASLIDPLTTTTMPPELTAATGMDALCHAFEAYVSALNSPFTDLNALGAARLVAENLQGAYANPKDMKYRDGMMTASAMAGLAFSNASLGLVHAMAHSMDGFFGLVHGECNALLLEHVVRFNYAAASDRYAQLAKAVGVAPASGQKPGIDALVEWLVAFRRSIGITQRLSEMGVDRDSIPMLAEHALQDACLATNPRPATQKEVERLYEAAF